MQTTEEGTGFNAEDDYGRPHNAAKKGTPQSYEKWHWRPDRNQHWQNTIHDAWHAYNATRIFSGYHDDAAKEERSSVQVDPEDHKET